MAQAFTSGMEKNELVKISHINEIVRRLRAIQRARGILEQNLFPEYSPSDPTIVWGTYLQNLRDTLRNLTDYTIQGDAEGNFSVMENITVEVTIIEDIHYLEMQQMVSDAEDRGKCKGGCSSTCGQGCTAACTEGCGSACSSKASGGSTCGTTCTGTCAKGCHSFCMSCTGSCVGGCSSCLGRCSGCHKAGRNVF